MPAKFDFDTLIDRRGTDCVKYDQLQSVFGRTDILPMWVADMDFRTAPEIIEAAEACCHHGVFGYTFRTEEAKQAFIDWVADHYGYTIRPEWISISPGVVTALSICVQALTQEHDKVMILTPVYPPFFAVINENGRELVTSPLQLCDDRYGVDWEDFEAKIRGGVKLFILCNSHNPVGRVWTREELRRMGDICCRYGVLILSDEIHADLALPGHTHTVMASVSEEIAARTVTAMAPSKTFNIAGMMNSLVFSSSPELLSKYNREMFRLHLDVGNLFGHLTLKTAYRHGGEWLEALRAYLGHNADFADTYIRERMPFVRSVKPEGSFLLWLDFRPTGLSHEEVGRILVDKARVGLNDGEAFGKEGIGFRRLNFGCPLSVLEKGLERIRKAFD